MTGSSPIDCCSMNPLELHLPTRGKADQQVLRYHPGLATIFCEQSAFLTARFNIQRKSAECRMIYWRVVHNSTLIERQG